MSILDVPNPFDIHNIKDCKMKWICKECFIQLEERAYGDKVNILINIPVICFEDKNCEYYKWIESSNQIKKMKWISVKDRLPEYDQKVLIWGTWYKDFNKNNIFEAEVGRFVRGEWRNECCGLNYTVTHWMPIPSEPPKELK